jgi:hypothetical protein
VFIKRYSVLVFTLFAANNIDYRAAPTKKASIHFVFAAKAAPTGEELFLLNDILFWFLLCSRLTTSLTERRLQKSSDNFNVGKHFLAFSVFHRYREYRKAVTRALRL